MDLDVESGQPMRRLARAVGLLWLALVPAVALCAINLVDFDVLRQNLQQPLQPQHGASLLAYSITLGLTVLPVLLVACSLLLRPGNFRFTASLAAATVVGVGAGLALMDGSRMPVPSLVLLIGSPIIAVLSAIGLRGTRPSGEVAFMPPPTHEG